MFKIEKTYPILSLICFFATLLMIGGCVPQRKIKLLQEEANVKDQAQADVLLKIIKLQPPVYTLKPGDVLSLQIRTTTPAENNFLAAPATTFGTERDPLLTGYTLDENGNLNLPVIGNVNLLNLSMQEARVRISSVLLPYFEYPTVNLRLLTFKYTIVGEVLRQGQFTSLQDNLNLMEALASAGGMTPFANRGQIRLIRQEGGEAKIYMLSLLEDDIIGMKNYYIQPNDMIVIDPLPARFFRENIVQNFTLMLSVVSSISLLVWRFTR
ncbi:hypothetical protein FVR03_10040 [Pontibacter qinzhouensis]|uniref:Uncharacterized protein n=1 Tax=Pontibacter qinzhouensis TaxID=2603253 RepID=A0A5C8KAH9_9BACT|nr:polysaccharide biosynthesis/export family protein [Pontibacter qinzhouensis]TXK46951.1 hypothetical protein FVR03_10040 [Pontibacter qinzhouensis]